MTACPLHPDAERPCPLCGIARVRAALAAAPKPTANRAPDDPHDPTRSLAIARAKLDRKERTP